MAKPNLSNREPLIVETASAVAWLTSYRSDLTNSITVTHTSANLLTFSCALTATQFNGSGTGLTGIPPSALLAGGTDGQVLVKNGASWSWSSGGGSGITLGSVLAGFALGTDGTALTALDTILQGFQKLQVQSNNKVDLTSVQTVGGAKSFTAITTISNATASTSITTGALVVTGGAGIGGALNAGGWISTIANLGSTSTWPPFGDSFAGSMGWNFNSTNELGFMNNRFTAAPNSFQFFQRTGASAFTVLMTITNSGIVSSLGGFTGSFLGTIANTSGWLNHTYNNAGGYPVYAYNTTASSMGWNFGLRNEASFMNNYGTSMDSFGFYQRTGGATNLLVFSIGYQGGATFPTVTAIPFLTSTRTDLTNSVTFIHTSAGLITCSGTFAATQFNGSGAGLTSIPPAALLAGGVDGQVLAKAGTSWAWTTAGGGGGLALTSTLTGFTLGTDGTALSALDTILQGFQKLQVQSNAKDVAGVAKTITTTSAVAFLTSTRSDLVNSVTFTHTSTGLVTFSGTFAATQFNGSGVGLTSIPPAALLAGGSDGQILAKNGTSWSWVANGTGGGTGAFESRTSDYAVDVVNIGKAWVRVDGMSPVAKIMAGCTALLGVEMLIVGGGAGGFATQRSGGGGAGGWLPLTGLTLAGSYPVVVGAGGAVGANGNDSSFGTWVALKGGTLGAGLCGSGDGASPFSNPLTGYAGTSPQGYAGGNGEGPDGAQRSGGGGGGAGGPGVNAVAQKAGNGGPGLSSTISGTLKWYCGGGGGSKDGAGGAAGTGGSGVGGNGQVGVGAAATAGAPNTGSGGGAGGGTYGVVVGTAAAGGSGVVIVRYPTANGTATGGVITYDGLYTIHTFTSGTSTFTVTSGTVGAVLKTLAFAA